MQGQDAGLEGSVLGSEESRPVLGDVTNTPRPVKRMRLKDASDGGRGGKEDTTAQYFATLHEKVQGTPKSEWGVSRDQLKDVEADHFVCVGKHASRRSLILDRPAVEVKEAGDRSSETPDTSNDNMQQDSLRASESPVLDDVRGVLASTEHIQDTVEPDHHSSYSERVMASDDDAASGAEVAQITEDATDADTHSESTALDVALKFLDTADHMEEEVEAGANLSSAQLVEAIKDDAEETAEAEMDAKFEKASNNTAFNIVSLEASSPAKHETTGHTQSSPAVAVGTEQSPAATREVTPNQSRTLITGGGNVVASFPSPVFFPIIPEVLASTVNLNSPQSTVSHDEPMAPRESVTPKPSSTLKLPQPRELFRAESLGQSPPIGTSLLRRESLRRKESPNKKRSSRKTRSPKKMNTLSRRDALQEREILQKVISEISPEQSIEDVDNGLIMTPAPGSEALQENAEKVDLEGDHHEKKFKNKDLQNALEAIEAYESPQKTKISGSSVTVSANNIQATKTLDNTDESTAKMEIDEAVYALETDKETDSSNRKTRSGGRFSDDTSMLKEFLNRAQAKKAAKKHILSVPDLSNAPKPQVSPRRSPRKALGSHDGNALSPRKQRNILNRPATPPGKPKLDAPDSDEVDEICEEVTSCRRSTRTRLPAPSKTPPGAPSFIPVRRADGADPVILHKSQAQELAMVTRANTRRNKGQSKPPILVLQDLPAATTEIALVTKQRAENAKTVDWAEKLASYQDAKDADEAEETRPKVRRMRGLGAANGTPAPKRTTAVVSISNGTPAPKRRGRVR